MPRKLVGGVCPCGSGDPAMSCCLQPDGKFRIQLPSLTPNGPVTGFCKSGCYLAETANCSHDLSAEHYISKTVLEEIGMKVFVEGLSWLVPNTRKEVGIGALTANVLCSRHNSSLSNLDAHAGKFMRILKAIEYDFLQNPMSETYSASYLISGEMLEAWMQKVLLGIHFSGNAAGPDGPSFNKFPINMDRVLDALYNGVWGSKCGLYIFCSPGSIVTSRLSFEVMILCGLSKNMTYGARIRICGLEFYIVIDDLHGNVLISPDNVMRRPSYIRYQKNMRQHTIVMTWGASEDAADRGIILTRAST